MSGKDSFREIGCSNLSRADFKKRKKLEIVGSQDHPLIQAKIVEISWKGNIKCKRNKVVVSAPHWSASGVDLAEKAPTDMEGLGIYDTGSIKPGVLKLADQRLNEHLTVVIEVQGQTTDCSGTLRGNFCGLKFEAVCPIKPGRHQIGVKITNFPTTTSHLHGYSTWTLEVPRLNAIISFEQKCILELFIIFNDPVRFIHGQVWVEALRFLYTKAGISGLKTSASIAAAITRHCHTKHGMTYDTVSGKARFVNGATGGDFPLMLYIAKMIPTVNCYDQAAAVQALCGAVGVKTDWIFMDPYGYINTTNLVGIGPCNNPFYRKNPARPRPPIVNKNDPERTSFGNHAFIMADSKIYDACAGPHTGSETFSAYIKSAIDLPTTMKVFFKSWIANTPEDTAAILEGSAKKCKGISEL